MCLRMCAGEESWELDIRWLFTQEGEGGVEVDSVDFSDELMMILRLCACEGV